VPTIQCRIRAIVSCLKQPLLPLAEYGIALFVTLGWFLMSAPYSGPATNRKIDSNAPLSEWHILAPYDLLASCEGKRLSLMDPSGASSTDEKSIRCVPDNDRRIDLGATLEEASQGTPR
jgi:hypothetical protein